MTTFTIRYRWPDQTLDVELDASLDNARFGVRLGAAVKIAFGSSADLRGADLSSAVLRSADLRDAVLNSADLRGADLSDAVLSRADLRDAVLSGADLSDADLRDAVLRGADLRDAVLRGADLRDADLSGADLRPIEADLYHVLVGARAETPGLLNALREGRIDGSTYHGPCACLMGTIANVRQVAIETLTMDSARPIERFFLTIRKGDTPATNPHAKIAEEWILKFLGGEPETV